MATCRAGAASKNIPLYQHIAQLAGKPTTNFVTPVPALNIINGGQHAGNGLEMQEFMILPTGADGFKDSMRMGVEVYHSLKSLLVKMFGKSSSLIGDEGGFGAPQIRDENHTLEIIMEAIENSGHAGKIDIGLDCAAAEFYDAEAKTYNLGMKNGTTDRIMTPAQLLDVYSNLADKYPIVSIEDPYDQDDFDGFVAMTKKMGD
jgi:enolase